MKVLIKKPGCCLETIEVSDLKEINKLLDNLDENGEGKSSTGSDLRQGVFEGIDMHMNGNALFNLKLPENFRDANGNLLYCGNVIFTGYDTSSGMPYGVCSLRDDQIEYIKANIGRYYDIL